MVGLVTPNLSRTWTADQLDEGDSASPGTVVELNNKTYKFLKYNEGTGAVAAMEGYVAYYYSASGYINNEMTMDLSDTAELGAGVMQAAPADGEYCWVQIEGPAVLEIALTAGANGDPLTPTGATDGTLTVTAAVTDHVCAYAGNIGNRQIACNFPR